MVRSVVRKMDRNVEALVKFTHVVIVVIHADLGLDLEYDVEDDATVEMAV